MKKLFSLLALIIILNPNAVLAKTVPTVNTEQEEPQKEKSLIFKYNMPPLQREHPVMEGKVQALEGEAPVKIKPAMKITTSDPLLKEGDLVEFEVTEDVQITNGFEIQKGEKAIGMITKLVDNGFNGSPAGIVIDQFVIARDNGEKYYLNGNIIRTGKKHDGAINSSNYIIGPAAFWIRGGEVHFDPKKDEFTIFLNNLERNTNL